MENGRIHSIERDDDLEVKDYIVPGLIDAHIHIESTMLPPSRFAEVALPHGTTGVVADPHEIVNISGMKGYRYMVEDAEQVPLKFFFTAPSCVPSTPLDPGGAVVGVEEVREMLQSGAVALGEMMNFPGVLNRDRDLMEKIRVARSLGRPVDGHAPGLRGKELDLYINAGITTDHECLSYEEAWEKAGKGMIPIIREGSVARGLDRFYPLIERTKTFLCTDDQHPPELAEGHIDSLVHRLLARGVNVFSVLRAATLNPATHYGLDTGILSKGRAADFLILEDLEPLTIKEVYVDGRKVAEYGRPLFSASPRGFESGIIPPRISPEDFVLRAPRDYKRESIRVRTIELRDNELYTQERIVSLPVKDGMPQLLGSVDVARAAIVSRYGTGRIGLGFLSGFGLKEGAIAMSIAHDAHNFVVVGKDGEEMFRALGLIVKTGGIGAVFQGEERRLALPIAGLMTPRPPEELFRGFECLRRLAWEMGVGLRSPFISLSFIALPVIPELKLTPGGYFRVREQKFVSPFT